MFGANEIVGKKFFKDAPKDSLLVTSRFFTIQGEGPYRGFPAYFVRLAKCNLACSFCDTYFDSGEYQTFDQIFADADKQIGEFYARRGMEVPMWAKYDESLLSPRKIVLVITGGEPTLQSNLTKFLEQANKIFFHTQIESNGTDPLALPDETTLVCSPKCLEKKRNGIDVAVRYLEPKKEMLERADCLKFVMCAPDGDQSQFTPYSEIPQWAHEWAAKTGKEVFVSPMNIYLQEPQKAKNLRVQRQSGEITIEERSTVDEVISFWEPGLLDMEKNRRNHEYTADYAMRHGFILNLQIHLFASLP
jgi:organic radical activating enzyme